jgi:ribosomal 30S subunit maturation factor RimM
MMVYDSNGNEVGEVTNFTVMPAGEYLIIKNIYIPFQIGRFIASVSKEEKKIVLTELGTETLK